MAGARNYQGKESEQSKARRGRKADELAGEGSTAGKMKKSRKHKQSRLDEITGGSMKTTRGETPPQYGQGSHETVDAEGNQDTLK